jgi:5-methylcytosine-specific restriction endonuclease McrA
LAKQSGSLCNRCKSSNNLGVHHKDRNRSNNEISNLEVLCARCHRIEHECWKNLPKGEELSRLKYIQSLFAKRKNGRFSR